MADTADLKSAESNLVRVRISFLAPLVNNDSASY